jgi:hypothetical protein
MSKRLLNDELRQPLTNLQARIDQLKASMTEAKSL